ncbi:MAG: DDE-type integrase/transposase/recombinase [Balneolales bacterium]
MNILLEWQDISRQAVHQGLYLDSQRSMHELQTLDLAEQVRRDHPSMGCRDIYHAVASKMPRGRDWTEQLLLDCGYRAKRSTRSFTEAGKDICPNLIEGMQITESSQLWQTDITYVWTKNRWYYVSFIFDVYTRQILSRHCSRDLNGKSQIQCLNKALKKVKKTDRVGLIVHTDRGTQYTSLAYRKYLTNCGISHSMAHYAWENAFCERVHRTIKHNYLKHYQIECFDSLKAGVAKAVRMYNGTKPHRGLPGRVSPDQFVKERRQDKHTDYEVKIWSKLTSTKTLHVN